MTWAVIIKLMLQLVVQFTSWLSDEQQQKLGRDAEIADALTTIATRTGIAKSIDLASAGWTADDINKQLHDFWRD